ncbi:MAG: hypothetical protein KU28_02055 [Sulfurovum sp. PC08-66]|nr:MAG: hypothetical protein KU28_02055 [Sulfurovum sp. PC08-66]
MKQIFLKGLLVGSCLFFLEGASYIDKLVENNDTIKLKELIAKTQTVEHDTDLPRNPKEHDLIIVENEYEVKTLFEFHDAQWSEKSNPHLAILLGNHQGTTYGNLFNYKVNAKEFDPYTKEDFKYTQETKSSVKLKILSSSNNEEDINEAIKTIIFQERIDVNAIISIQILQLNVTKCNIALSYRDK